MNKFFSTIAALMLVLLIFMTVSTLTKTSKLKPEGIPSMEYHFQVFIQNQDERFISDFSKGVKEVSDSFGVYTELITFDDYSKQAISDAVLCAVYSDIDAIAFSPYDDSTLSDAIDMAGKNDVGIAFYSADTDRFSDIPVLGSNYDIGKAAAQMCIKADAEHGKTVVITNGYENGTLRIKGIEDTLKEYPDAGIDYTYCINSPVFEIKEMVDNILETCPDVKNIICLDEKSTSVIAGNLINLHKINDINLIGYGLAEQTLNGIENGIIYATVADDAYALGRAVVSQLYDDVSGNAQKEYSIDINCIMSLSDENKDGQ